MTTLLQISLILASLAIVVMVGFLLPTLISAKQKLDSFFSDSNQLRANINELVGECRELAGQISKLAERGAAEMDEVHQVVHTVHEWTHKANGIIENVESAVQPVMQKVNKFRVLISAIAQMFSPKLPQSS